MARYTPILRWKRGEKNALQALTQAGRIGVSPLIVISPEMYTASGQTLNRPAVTAADKFIQEVQTAWGTNPFYVDASALGASSATGTQAIAAIAASARTAGLHLIPAASFSASPAYFTALTQVAQQDAYGVGLRADLSEFTTAANWAPSWIIPLSQTDLIADFGGNVGAVSALGSTLLIAFNGLYQRTSWRSVSVAGTSMPPTLQGYPQGNQLIQRAEWLLWQSLSAGIIDYPLNYADYATVNPNAPPPPPGGVGFPINAKYTLDSHFLVCRGVKPSGPTGQPQGIQYQAHAQSIYNYPNRNALAHAWADITINDIVNIAGTSPGNPEKWVKIAINRHIELVRNNLP